MPSVLLTRPAHLSAALQRQLEAMGWKTYTAPMLSYHDTDTPLPDLSVYEGVVFTSSEAIAAYSRKNGRNDFPVYAVGDATADAARIAGFTHIVTADGDAESLMGCLKKDMPKKLLHIGGADMAKDLSALFPTIDRHVIYKAETVGHMPDNVAEAIRQQKIDAVLLFSPRSAAQFAHLLRQSGLENHLAAMSAYSFSAAVQEKLAGLSFRKLAIAEKTSLSAIVALLNTDKK